jgi:hypothetical protein
VNVKPEDAWSGRTVTIPDKVYRFLKAGFVVTWADWVINHMDTNAEHRIVLLGDPFGLVFAWMWARDRDQAMILLADFMTELRDGHPLAYDIDPPIRLDEILGSLRLALPWGFDEYNEVVTMARREVPKHYGRDVNSDVREDDVGLDI